MKANKLAFTIAMSALFTSFGSGAFAQDYNAAEAVATDPLSYGATVQVGTQASKSRDEVRSEARQAATQDMHSNQISGDHASHVAPAPKATQQAKSRDMVRAEARQAAVQDIHSNQVSGDHTSHTAQ